MRHLIAMLLLPISLLLAPVLHAAPSIDRLVYDVKSPGQFCWLEKLTAKGKTLSAADISAILAGTKSCPAEYLFNNQMDFFRTGAVVQLFVIHGRLRSVFNITANGTEIQPELPQIRGIPDAQPAQAPAAPGPGTKGGGVQVTPLTDDIVGKYSDKAAPEKEIQRDLSILQLEYLKAQASNAKAMRAKSLLLGTSPFSALSLPGFTLGSIKAFADSLLVDTQSPLTQIPFTDRALFEALAIRCDSLVESVQALNSRLTESKFADLVTSAQTDADTFKADAVVAAGNVAKINTRFASESLSGIDALSHYLPTGDKYGEIETTEVSLQAGADEIPSAVDAVNSDLLSIFNNINTIYEHSETAQPFVVLIGQWAKNEVVQIELREVPGFKHYGFGEAGDVQLGQSQEDQQQPSAVPVRPPVQKLPGQQNNPTVNDNSAQGHGSASKQSSGQGPTEAKGNLLETYSFSVHQFFRANVVSGFFASSLHDRAYGVEQIPGSGGQPTQTVATVGDVTQPQVHYFVGLNYYFKQRDVFPGALRTSDYFIPGAFFGYGVDDSKNFLLGPNWETKWGIDVGLGVHIGHETFLRKDIIAGTTPLASSATSPPTVSKPKLGTYFSVGFDLSVFKNVFGQLTGGSTNTDKASQKSSSSK